MLKVSGALALVALGGLYLASERESERPVVTQTRASAMEDLEKRAQKEPEAAAELMRKYVEAHTPGMAERLYKSAPEAIQNDLEVRHAFARALAEQGRAREALAVQQDVMARCEKTPPDSPACGTWLISASKRRLSVFEELVRLGVDDAVKNPERAQPAYEKVLSTLATAEHR